jgi:hypothetical protein
MVAEEGLAPPDTRIMIPLIQIKLPLTHLAHLSKHRDPRLNARPNLAPPLAILHLYQQTLPVTPEARGSSCSILRPMYL